MKRSSIWTATLAVATILTTWAWAQPGPGGAHGGGPSLATGGSHSGEKASTSEHESTKETNAFEARIADNPRLSSRLQPLLPAGTSLQTAASGFKNQGQFIAALHVSHNLNIPFSQIKGDMTGAHHDSLGRSIRELRPDLGSKTVKSNVKLAETETKTDLEQTSEAGK